MIPSWWNSANAKSASTLEIATVRNENKSVESKNLIVNEKVVWLLITLAPLKWQLTMYCPQILWVELSLERLYDLLVSFLQVVNYYALKLKSLFSEKIVTSNLSDCVGDARKKGSIYTPRGQPDCSAHMQARRSEGLVTYLLQVRGGGFI